MGGWVGLWVRGGAIRAGGSAYLQFVQPVLTLGLLVRGLRWRRGVSLEPADGVGEVV